METSIIKDISTLGAAGLMFLVYYISHQSTFSVIKSMLENINKSFEANLKTQNDAFQQSLNQQSTSFTQSLNNITAWADKLLSHQASIDERQYQSTKEQLEALQVLVAAVTRIETKVDGIKSIKGGHHD
ncbi:hypothetical protein IJT17_10115 [bacterium]|nr:hypothetical protein [bacterium]